MKMRISKLALLPIFILIILQFSCVTYRVASDCIVIYGDSRTTHDVHHDHQKIVNAIVRSKPKLVFHTGDLVANGLDQSHWDIFNKIISGITKIAEFYPVLGNHEYDSQLFFDNFVLPNNERWYSVERDGIHFIVLDSNSDMDIASKQYKWLKSDLSSRTKETKFTVVIFHHPIFSLYMEDEKKIKPVVVPLFEKYGVDIVFNGHTHAYERFFYNNIYYIVTGGGGASLHNQVRTDPYNQVFVKAYHFCKLYLIDSKLVVNVVDIDLNLIDQFELYQK